MASNKPIDTTMAGNSSSDGEDLGAAFAKAAAAKAASRAAEKRKNKVVVPLPEPEADAEEDEPESCLIYGHNALIPGQWFSNRDSAYQQNAHEEVNLDVTPGPEGAYSIIVTYDENKYFNEDIDGGETILFAGTGAATWKKSKETLKNPATQALDASIKSRKPVRVLRAAPKASAQQKIKKEELMLYPTKGLRYDGLYRVVSAMRGEINLATNGKYDAYCLKRLPIVDEDKKKKKKAENEYAQCVLKEAVRRCGQGYGGYAEGPPKGI